MFALISQKKFTPQSWHFEHQPFVRVNRGIEGCECLIMWGGGEVEEVCHWWKKSDFFSGLHSLRWSFSINVSLTLFIITIATTTSSPCYRGFNGSRKPANFATYFPNHCWLLSMLNFIWVVTVITKSIFSTEFDARMQEMSLLGFYIPKFSRGECPKTPLGGEAL